MVIHWWVESIDTATPFAFKASIIVVAICIVNLSWVCNLFPIPLLDGGHIALNTIEGLRGKEFTEGTIDKTFRIGFSIVATLMIFSIVNDLINNFTRIENYFRSLLG